MAKLLDEIKHDLNFIKSHKLQPEWFKILKTFILIGFFVGYCALFGALKMVIFLIVFISLMLAVHMVYRVKTARWTQSWLDFVVTEENGEATPTGIGKFYYMAIAISAILGLVISQLLP